MSKKYAFCEPVTAAPGSRWHIRKLTDKGVKLSGGVDTPALCGREVCWDLAVGVDSRYFDDCCPKCVEEFREQSG